jgi:hypothetical protein
MLIMMLARISVWRGDLVRYMPRFADPYRGELAVVERMLDESKNPIGAGPNAMPYWLEVRFKKDDRLATLNAQAFVVEEVRQSIARIL